MRFTGSFVIFLVIISLRPCNAIDAAWWGKNGVFPLFDGTFLAKMPRKGYFFSIFLCRDCKILEIMAKLYINKNITREADKMFSFFFTGDEGISYSDVNVFLESLPADEPVDVELYSCGGDCTEGFAIYDALRTCGRELSTTVVGECASMATVIALCAPKERRRAFKHARFLMHEPYYPECITGDVTLQRIEGLKAGLESDRQKIIDIYTERTGMTERRIVEQMEDGGWFDTDRAIKLGLVAEIVPETAAAAKDDLRISTTIKDDFNMKQEKNEAKSLWQRLGAALGMSETEKAVDLSLFATDGTEIQIEREEGDIQVGDNATPDGTFTLEDGRTVTIQGGVITEIKEPTETAEIPAEDEGEPTPAEDETEKEALQNRIEELERVVADLKAQIEALEENEKTDEDKEILNAVERLGGVAALKNLPVGRANIPQNERPQGSAERSVFGELYAQRFGNK